MKPRYNVFNQIHKALRALFYDTALMIQRTDFNKAEANATIERVRLVLNLLDGHSHHEDNFLFPHVMKHDAKLASEFEKDHEIDHELVEELTEHLNNWEKAISGSEKTEAGQKIFYAYNEFLAFNLYHMNKEETVLLYNLWSHYTDEELFGFTQQIIASIPMETLVIEMEWMMRSMSNDEIIEWLKCVKLGAPQELFLQLVMMAQKLLPANRWATIHAAIEPKMALA
jgi:hypothetical protein